MTPSWLQNSFRFTVFAGIGLGLSMTVIDFAMPWFRDWQWDSDRLVIESVSRSRTEGIGFVGGFMTSHDTLIHRRAVIAIDPSRAGMADLPYVAQYGLQYKLLAVLAPSDPRLLPPYFLVARLVGLLLFAAALAALIGRIHADVGLPAGAMTLLGLMLSPFLIVFGRSLYWAPVLLFLPFVVSFVVWEQARTTRARAGFMILIAGLVLIKALCGYEFLTNVAGSAAAGLVYATLKQGRPLREAARSVVLAAMASVVGFAVAASLHFLQARAYFGDSRMAREALALPIRYSTAGAAGIREDPVGAKAVIKVVFLYLNSPAFLIVSVQGIIVLLAAATALYVLMRKRGALVGIITDQRRRAHDALVTTAWVALPLSMLWCVALKHLMYHHHIDTIIFYLPFLPLAFASIGAVGDVAYQVLSRGRSS